MSKELVEFAKRKPTNRAEIKAWVSVFLGFSLHDTVRCNHNIETGEEAHSSQLDYVHDGFLNLYSAAVVMAARHAGKSYAAAVLDVLDCWFKPGCEIAVVAAVITQSFYIYDYCLEFIEKFERKIGQKVATHNRNTITFNNGSIIRFFSGKKNSSGSKGCHPHVIQVDEADLMTVEEFDGLSNGLRADGKIEPRFDVLSTNYKGGEGVISTQIEKYKSFNLTRDSDLLPKKVFKICLIDVLENCQKQCYNEGTGVWCALHSWCQGRAHEGTGFFSVKRALGITAENSTQNFEAEFLLLRPMSAFSYFHNFDSKKNVPAVDRELDPTCISFVTFDFGGIRCPHAAVVMQKDEASGVFYAVDEFLQMGNLEGLIDKVKAKYPNATDFECFADPKGEESQQIAKGVSYVGVLKKAGFHVRTTRHYRDKTARIIFDLISPADGKPRFIVNKRCKNLLAQIYGAETKRTKGGKPTTEIADDKSVRDDLLDCVRYTVDWASRPGFCRSRNMKAISYW